MRKLTLLLVAGLFTLGVTASQAGAATVTLTGTSLTLTVGSLPGIVVPGPNVPTPLFVSSGAGSFTEPAGLFGPATVALPRSLFTGVPSISGLTVLGLANGTKVVNGAAGTAVGGLAGTTLVNVLQLLNLNIPLSIVGAGGTAKSALAGIAITVIGQTWTTGVATVMGVTTTPGNVVLNTAALTGSDARNPTAHTGVMTLVTGFKAITNVAGNLPGFAIQSLSFVPEPATLLLVGSGITGLLIVGRRRLRK